MGRCDVRVAMVRVAVARRNTLSAKSNSARCNRGEKGGFKKTYNLFDYHNPLCETVPSEQDNKQQGDEDEPNK